MEFENPYLSKRDPQKSAVKRLRGLIWAQLPKMITNEQILRLRWDDEGLTSFTMWRIVVDICDVLSLQHDIGPKSRVLDATAGIGGAAMVFAQRFMTACVEIDVERARILRHNLQVIGVENPIIHVEPCQRVIAAGVREVIFFDPPWGGVAYKEASSLRLKISCVSEAQPAAQEPIEDTILRMQGKTRYCVVKLPFNYDLAYFLQRLAGLEIFHVLKYGRPYTCTIMFIRFP